MRHLAAAEAHGHLDLVAFLDEAAGVPHLDVVIVVVDVRTELDLLDIDDLLLLARLVLLLLDLVFVFSVVQNFANRRLGIWRRSEERRVGKECVSTCRSRWWPYHYKKKKKNQI